MEDNFLLEEGMSLCFYCKHYVTEDFKACKNCVHEVKEKEEVHMVDWIIPIEINENEGPEFSDRMEALAGEYIKAHDLDISVESLWNDATAEMARESLKEARENDEVFYACDFFDWLLYA